MWWGKCVGWHPMRRGCSSCSKFRETRGRSSLQRRGYVTWLWYSANHVHWPTDLVSCPHQVDHMHQLEHPPANCWCILVHVTFFSSRCMLELKFCHLLQNLLCWLATRICEKCHYEKWLMIPRIGIVWSHDGDNPVTRQEQYNLSSCHVTGLSLSWGHETKPFLPIITVWFKTWNYLPLAGRSPQREEKARRDAVSAPSHAQGTASVIMTLICTLLYCKNECHDIQKNKNLTSQFNDHIQKLNQPTGITYVVDYNSSNAHLWALASTFLLAWLEKKMRISVCVHTQFLVIELDYSCVPSWTSSAARDCSSSIEKHTNACACIILAQVHKRKDISSKPWFLIGSCVYKEILGGRTTRPDCLVLNLEEQSHISLLAGWTRKYCPLCVPYLASFQVL